MTSHECYDLAVNIRIEVSNSSLVPFKRDQLLLSVYESCKHRSKALSEASALTQTIIADLLKNHLHKGKLTRRAIITSTSETLQRFDPSAAAIYLAYHRQDKQT